MNPNPKRNCHEDRTDRPLRRRELGAPLTRPRTPRPPGLDLACRLRGGEPLPVEPHQLLSAGVDPEAVASGKVGASRRSGSSAPEGVPRSLRRLSESLPRLRRTLA